MGNMFQHNQSVKTKRNDTGMVTVYDIQLEVPELSCHTLRITKDNTGTAKSKKNTLTQKTYVAVSEFKVNKLMIHAKPIIP
ncbi:hypothetical protein AWM68_18100 [Fictibacillus phosphorivorans]|uniref:Uncharacterized protein n=1 Tax=Fictibacillus phosphorivorans TaxID=1221500 RepID=A0A163RW75_9BACL|nr:hypothetical protein AWM68_18100 [Fictibacillus phosphorivorans]